MAYLGDPNQDMYRIFGPFWKLGVRSGVFDVPANAILPSVYHVPSKEVGREDSRLPLETRIVFASMRSYTGDEA